MKKLFIVLLSVSLGTALFAGGNKAGPSGTGKKGTLANGDVALTVFYGGGYQDFVTSFAYADNLMTKHVVDETGINLIIDSAQGADVSTRLGAMLSSGDYPDLIISRNFSRGDLAYYGEQGIFIPLDQYLSGANLNKYPNIKKAFEQYPVTKNRITGSDGKIYGLPAYNDCLHCLWTNGTVTYYMPFMRDNGFKLPTTYDEFVIYLRWVKNNDANKNGNKNDEIPFTWYNGDMWNTIAFFAHNYMPWVPGGIGVFDGKVTAQYRQNEFRNAIRMIAGLYKEGIIAPDAFTMTHEELQGLQDGAIPVMGVTGGDWVPAQRGNARYVEHHILPPLKAVNGQIYGTNQRGDNGASVGMVITDKCKNPELAIALYDYLISWQNQQFLNDGPKGLIWNDPDPGALSYLGTPALFKIDDRQRQLNAGWGWVFHYPKEVRYGMQANGIEDAQKWFDTWDASLRDKLAANPNYPNLFAYIDWSAQAKYPMPASNFLPALALSAADQERANDISATLDAFKDQAMTDFITGVTDINRDADWNAYINQLNQLSDNELISIYQKYVK